MQKQRAKECASLTIIVLAELRSAGRAHGRRLPTLITFPVHRVIHFETVQKCRLSNDLLVITVVKRFLRLTYSRLSSVTFVLASKSPSHCSDFLSSSL